MSEKLKVTTDHFIKPHICKSCNGSCCKQMPGCNLPTDCAPPLSETLVSMLSSGNYAIDAWEGDPIGGDRERVYYVRPRTKSAENKLYDFSWGGECIFFEDGKGCSLKEDERPAGCLLLEPKEDGECKVHGAGKQEAATAWIPYQDEIIDAEDAITWR